MSYTLALGPFATPWRGPQRLVLTVANDRIADVDYRVGYNERECAARLSRLNMEQSLHLVSRICGACSHAHTLAFCQAVEALLELDVPLRAAYLRVVVAELERLSVHLAALAALFGALGQERFQATLHDLGATARQAMRLVSGQPTFPDMCQPGGVRRDLADQERSEALTTLARLNRQIFPLIDRVIDQRALLARTVDVGTLSNSVAIQFGLCGPLARASGLTADLRLDQPYAAYDRLQPRLIVQEGGDVYARLVVLLLESFESVKLAEEALRTLPAGAWQHTLPSQMRAGQVEGAVESPHGALRYQLESDGRRLTSVAIQPPRQIDRLLARSLLGQALLDNVVLIVLSTNPCTACAEC